MSVAMTGQPAAIASTSGNPNPSTAVVGPGVEWSGVLWDVDIGYSSVLATMTAGGSQNFGGTQTVVLSDLDYTCMGPITGISNFMVLGFWRRYFIQYSKPVSCLCKHWNI